MMTSECQLGNNFRIVSIPPARFLRALHSPLPPFRFISLSVLTVVVVVAEEQRSVCGRFESILGVLFLGCFYATQDIGSCDTLVA